jgi:oxygen-independent coproporphyrinogen-3 oxidase
MEELNFAFQLSPQHLSLYTLIVDENTPLGKMVKDGNIEPKTEYEMADFYDATNDFILNSSSTNEGKINQYEVSNYAVSGYESRHNLCYWKSYDYIGIGAMAHGRLRYADGERYEITNINDVKKWISNIGNDGNGLVVEKKLSQKENIEEILLMGLRTTTGIDVADTNKRFNIQINYFLNEQQINNLAQDGFLVFNNNILRLTRKGMLILDTILQKILI